MKISKRELNKELDAWEKHGHSVGYAHGYRVGVREGREQERARMKAQMDRMIEYRFMFYTLEDAMNQATVLASMGHMTRPYLFFGFSPDTPFYKRWLVLAHAPQVIIEARRAVAEHGR